MYSFLYYEHFCYEKIDVKGCGK